jgi:DNA primase
VKTMETGTTSIVTVLKNLGVDIKRVGDKEISGCCPVHLKTTGRVDNSPSWSMNAETGAWICYSCGARGSLYGLLSELSGDLSSIWDIKLKLVETGLSQLSQEREVREDKIDWISYNKFSEVPAHLLSSRNIDSTTARKFGIKWNTEKKAWVIPIVSPDGELKGWQEKKTDWVRNYPIGVKKSESLFGIERFSGGTAVLLESPLDVVRLATVTTAVQGLATFGAHVSKTQLRILSSVATGLIVAMDNDPAGIESASRIWESSMRFRNGVLWLNYSHTNAKDIGDMTDEEINVAIDSATVLPSWLS